MARRETAQEARFATFLSWHLAICNLAEKSKRAKKFEEASATYTLGSVQPAPPSRRTTMRKRRIIVRRRSRWTVHEWEQGWDLAMTRIQGVQECLTVLDGAFADGNRLGFELGLGALIDFCTETVNKGDFDQWWN